MTGRLSDLARELGVAKEPEAHMKKEAEAKEVIQARLDALKESKAKLETIGGCEEILLDLEVKINKAQQQLVPVVSNVRRLYTDAEKYDAAANAAVKEAEEHIPTLRANLEAAEDDLAKRTGASRRAEELKAAAFRKLAEHSGQMTQHQAEVVMDDESATNEAMPQMPSWGPTAVARPICLRRQGAKATLRRPRAATTPTRQRRGIDRWRRRHGSGRRCPRGWRLC